MLQIDEEEDVMQLKAMHTEWTLKLAVICAMLAILAGCGGSCKSVVTPVGPEKNPGAASAYVVQNPPLPMKFVAER